MNTFADAGFCAPPRSIYPTRSDVQFESPGTLIYGEFEERSQLPVSWQQHFQAGHSFQIAEGADLGQISIEENGSKEYSLRESSALKEWIRRLSDGPVYIDITGLGHHVWMPILRFLLEESREVFCLYTEPGRYVPSVNPRPGEFYQLSEKSRGYQPIPTFARIPSRSQRAGILVPLLGFEGVRYRYLIENEQPAERDVFPIVGIPGFEIDYPFHTFEGNAEVLKETRSWQRVDFVDAACPFSLFNHLNSIRANWPSRLIRLAIIGTKPHALGAVLYALRDGSVELLHDHPIRKKGRTDGSGRCHLYRVSVFLRHCL